MNYLLIGDIMKLTLVYNPVDSKLRPEAYCSVFKDMFNALVQRFEHTQFIKQDCNLEDLDDSDLIFFFDPHSSHHIQIGGIEKHPAYKMEYWNDPHQKAMEGIYKSTNQPVKKLGRDERVRRAEARGIDTIICPVRDFFLECFPEMKDKLFWFPHAPKAAPLWPYSERKKEILGNGATWGGYNNGYDFRKWAYEQPYVEAKKHWIVDKSTPMGSEYRDFLSEYAASMALCSVMPVPKYYEIPAAGCVCFAEHHQEYEDLGFVDFESCVYVNQDNFRMRALDFLKSPAEYGDIAFNGYKLMVDRYSANHFADAVFNHVKHKKEN